MTGSIQPQLRSWAVWLLACGLLVSGRAARAATIAWSGASGTDTNWSNGNNWVGAVAPGGGDDVKFFDPGTNLTLGLPNSLVDGAFVGYIGSLQIGNTNGMHTIVIAAGQTLSVTNGNLSVGTPNDPVAARNLTNTITGAGATLMVSNAAANIGINQANSSAAPSRANLDLSGLNNFIVNANRIGIGDGQFPGVPVNNRAGGNLTLAKTNVITLAYTDTLANYQTAGKNAALIMSRNSGNNPGIISLLQLGIVNTFNVDSLNIGMDKSGNNSTAAHGVLKFNPVLAGQNPVANFYGAGGPGTRVTWWSIGDGNQSSSTSNGGGGTNDFSLGTVNAFVNVMSLARDAASASDTWAGPHKGVLIFTNGTIDANTVLVGNQSLETGTSTASSLGIVTLNGAGATLKVNSALTLGVATLATGAGPKTYGVLNVTNGTVFANNITVGVNSVSNLINLVNGTLIVTNTLATNQSGLFSLYLSNATLGLSVAGNSSLRGLVQTLNTVGAANTVQLDPTPVIFPAYPTNVALIRYTTWIGSNTFALASVPAWAPGATLVSNGPNKTLDLSLPTDPRPIITSGPFGYSGNPGDNVASSFAVTVANGSGATLTYRWYYFTNGAASTNLLADGPGPSGLSTLVNSGTANLVLNNAQPADNGNYFVTVSNAYGVATSSLAVLNISAGCVAPLITGPNNQTVIQGNNATFSATVSANPAAYLQWQTNGVDVPGANGSSLALNNVQYPANDQEVVSLIATNPCGNVTNSAVLTVIVPPCIVGQPVSLMVTNTQAASFTVTASCAVPAVTYQWYKNNNPISTGVNPTATSATLSIAGASASDTANYFVRISNSAGVTNSATVALTVNSTMSFLALQPVNNQTNVCYDTPLYITFDRTPSLRTAGTIKIFNVTNSATPVDTIDMSQGALQARLIATETFSTYPVIITGNQAAIYPHLDLLTSNQTYYVTIDDGVFADAAGAYFAGITATNAWQFTTKPGGPANSTNIVVAQDDSGDFATVQGALDSLPASNPSLAYITAHNGVYTEVVEFKKSNIVLRGQSRNGVIIGYANNSLLNASTHFRMAMKVNANNIALDNLTVSNSTPQDLSQAEALMIETGAEQVTVNNCNIDSYQDTILANTATSMAYFYNSLIQGDVDFIWGGGNLFFTNCEIRYLVRAANAAALGPNPSPQPSEVTSNQFSFVNCRFTTLPGANPNDTIGRTRGIAGGETVLITCIISTNISGWSSDALPTNNFQNYFFNCTNDLGQQLTLTNGIALSPGDPLIAKASTANVWLYGWQPQLAPNILSQPAGQTVNANQSASFFVSATGVPDPSYQWLKGGTPLPGQTGASLTIANASGLDIGAYSVVVSNAAGTVTSSVANLNVIAPAAPPSLGSTVALNNGNMQFTIAGVPGSAGFSYRVWATTNLALTPVIGTWTLLTNDVFGVTPTVFTDTTTVGLPERFYIITVP